MEADMDNRLKIGFIGAGALATTLSIAFKQRGFPIVAVSSRGYESARTMADLLDGCRAVTDNQKVADNADLVFIATPDDIIPAVASQIRWHKGQSVVHCSGADSIDILNPARQAGAYTGVFHPLQTFAAMMQENLKGITFALEAGEPLLTLLKEMSEMLGGHWIELKAKDRVLYHAAAVFACNYLVTLTSIAVKLWGNIDVPQYKAIQALLPLMRGTLNNIEATGVMQSLTGRLPRRYGDHKKISGGSRCHRPRADAPVQGAWYQHHPRCAGKRQAGYQASQGDGRYTRIFNTTNGETEMRTMMKSKIHRARVTGLDINYEGSITIDRKLMQEADILPYEQVHILNINNGARFSTYAIEGESGSGQICLNGASARLACKGDIIIILTYSQVEENEAADFTPTIVHVDRNNEITGIKHTIESLSL
jgi:L-aspartate-alpha-decarboxylase